MNAVNAMKPYHLNLADIQGNILRPYGRLGYPKARYIFVHVAEAAAGRAFLQAIRPKITSALRWDSSQSYPGAVVVDRPKVALNVAFNFYGLLALGVPTRTLAGLPAEFIDGMAARAHILGDLQGRNKWDYWDAIWQASEGATRVHLLVSLNAQMTADGLPVPELEQVTQWLFGLCAASGGKVSVLSGHGPDKVAYQDSSALLERQPDGGFQPTAKEHFRFTDGFGDPVFAGQYQKSEEKQEAIGGGKIGGGNLAGDRRWSPLAAGEFLLGHPDEAQEIPPGALPASFLRNGTFMAYRKLHQNVGSFQSYVADCAQSYAHLNGIADVAIANEIIRAKMVGRWSNGVPLMAAPTWDNLVAFNRREAEARAADDKTAIAGIERAYVDFSYRQDPEGLKCPVGAHMRRANTRDMLDPEGQSANAANRNGSVLNNRRRILRRGLPYGASDPAVADDDGEHGIIFLAVCASLFRQFEFVQQQWMQYGLDFNVGNDTCPLIGNHDGVESKFVIAAGSASGALPFICARLPQFVETRGGDYFFIPSLTSFRMIASGVVDPT